MGEADETEPRMDVVAIEMLSGGFAGQNRTLTVHADGTLQLLDRRFGRNETRQVPRARVQLLQDALSRPEWQEVGEFYGQPVTDGFMIHIEGGGKSTGYASPSAKPVTLPPILDEVLRHLSDLWSTEDVLEEPANELSAEIFKHWVHSHEEDAGDVEVYRPSVFPFPVSRGRDGFEIKEDGEFIQHDIGPSDGLLRVMGRWEAERADRIGVYLEGQEGRAYTLEIVSLDEDVLGIRKQGTVPTSPR